ncbi:MAG: hypothetical protein A2Z34_05215, partial [Planctomycetes bacterium RBG_16_59_8]
GYFLTEIKNFSSDDPRDNIERLIYRWRLEKKDPTAPLSPPIKPIVFWIENTTPHRYRDAVQKGILGWNRAFEKAGFSNAVEARIMPDDADWDPADVRYSVVRWITSSQSYIAGIGPARVNPLTGEILDADVLIEGETIRSMRRFYLDRLVEETGDKHAAGDACAYQTFKMQEAAAALDAMTTMGLIGPDEVPEEFLSQYIFGLVSHEVGHVLGLRHNFKGSTIRTLKELHDKKLAEEEGLIGSVMEYDPVNIAPPGTTQGYYCTPIVGPYDLWAIEYGYKPITADSPAGELPELRKIASRSGEPKLAYGTDEDAEESEGERWPVDPYCVRYDQSSDPIGYAEQQIKLSLSLIPKIPEKLAKEGENYTAVRNAFANLLGTYISNAASATKFVGGQRLSRSHHGDPGAAAPFTPVPLAEQQRALDLVAEYGLSDKHLRFDPNLMNLLAPSRWSRWHDESPRPIDFPFHEIVTSMHRNILDALYHPSTLERIADIESKTPEGTPSMTIHYLFSFLRSRIWSELAENRVAAISPIRRNLQKAHLRKLIEVMLSTGAALPEDARTLAWKELTMLQTTIGDAIKRVERPDGPVAIHLQSAAALIAKALDAQMQMPPQ